MGSLKPRSAALLALLTLGGCAAGARNAPTYDQVLDRCMRSGRAEAECSAFARHQAGPQERMLEESDWQVLAAQATDVIGDPDAQTHRLSNVGFAVHHRLQVEGDRCYLLGIAWPSSLASRISVGYEQTPSGEQVNDQVGLRSDDIAPPRGKMEFCADRTGTVYLTISAVDPSGVMVHNERFQYVLAVGTRVEGAEEQAERRELERQAVLESRARVEVNLQIADAERGGQAFASACVDCRRTYYACVDAPASQQCAAEFQRCAGLAGPRETGNVLCASP